MIDRTPQVNADGFTLRQVPDGSWEVVAWRGGVGYVWLDRYETRDWARAEAAARAPWPVMWAEVDGGGLVGWQDVTVGEVRGA